jgi:hypothetical protein
VTLIDAPQLNTLRIEFFDHIDFDCPRLTQFINRTLVLKHRKHDKAHVRFDYQTAGLLFGTLQIFITCKSDRRLSSVARVCSSSITSAVEDLYIGRGLSHQFWKNDEIENTSWLQLLLPFTAVKNLFLHKEFARGIAAALQELVGDRITEVLPNLQNIFVEKLVPFEKNIGQFVVTRELSGHPVAITDWDKDSDVKLM